MTLIDQLGIALGLATLAGLNLSPEPVSNSVASVAEDTLVLGLIGISPAIALLSFSAPRLPFGYDARIHPELAVIDAHPMVPVEEFVVAVSSERVALGQKLDRWLCECRRDDRLDRMFSQYVGNDDFPESSKRSDGGP